MKACRLHRSIGSLVIVRADSAYYTAAMAATACRAGAKFSITATAVTILPSRSMGDHSQRRRVVWSSLFAPMRGQFRGATDCRVAHYLHCLGDSGQRLG